MLAMKLIDPDDYVFNNLSFCGKIVRRYIDVTLKGLCL